MSLSTHSNHLEETILYSMLKDSKFITINPNLNENLTILVKKYYNEAVKYMEAVSDIFSEYTLHNYRHILNVIDIMGKIIPEKTLKSLNCLEASLLILSACFHDIGMYVDKAELKELKKDTKFKKSFYNFASHTSKLNKLKLEQSCDNPMTTDIIDLNNEINVLERNHLTEYIRKNNGKKLNSLVIPPIKVRMH